MKLTKIQVWPGIFFQDGFRVSKKGCGKLSFIRNDILGKLHNHGPVIPVQDGNGIGELVAHLLVHSTILLFQQRPPQGFAPGVCLGIVSSESGGELPVGPAEAVLFGGAGDGGGPARS
jgi:hypothetical protein